MNTNVHEYMQTCLHTCVHRIHITMKNIIIKWDWEESSVSTVLAAEAKDVNSNP